MTPTTSKSDVSAKPLVGAGVKWTTGATTGAIENSKNPKIDSPYCSSLNNNTMLLWYWCTC
jgi:hypothetical protein